MIYYFLSFLYNSSYVYKHICAKTSLLVRPDMREESSYCSDLENMQKVMKQNENVMLPERKVTNWQKFMADG